MCFVSYANWSATPIVATDLSNYYYYRNSFIKNLLVDATFIIYHICKKRKEGEKKGATLRIILTEFYERGDIYRRRKKGEKEIHFL